MNSEPHYQYMTKKVTCWGLGGNDKIISQLQSEIALGWEIVSMVEDHWRGGMLRHVYTVTLKKLSH